MRAGIDFGTCTTCISVDIDGKKQLVKCGSGSGSTEFYIPSALYLDDNDRFLVGQAAVMQKNVDPSRFIKEFKRNLGETIPLRLGTRDFLPEQLIQEVFCYLKNVTEQSGIIGHNKLEEVTVCHPANFSEQKKELLKNAALNAGFKIVYLLDEPTAACYYYDALGKIDIGDKILIYDLGGGTFDVSLMEKTPQGLKLLTRPLGIEECGGTDFDIVIYEYLLENSQENLEELMLQYSEEDRLIYKEMLQSDCIKAKEHLSTSENTQIAYQCGVGFKKVQLTREVFESLIKDYIDDSINKVQEIVRNARLKDSDINKILLVGGSCRIPYIQKRLRELYGDIIVKDVDPDWAIVMGSTYLFDMLSDKATERDDKHDEKATKEDVHPTSNEINGGSHRGTSTEINAKSVSETTGMLHGVVRDANSFANDQKLAAPGTLDFVLVDVNGNGNCKSINEAISLVKQNGKIMLHAGTYHEKVVINKPLTIMGYGEGNNVVIDDDIKLSITNGNEVVIERCIFTHSVIVYSPVKLSNCQFFGPSSGVRVYDNGQLSMEKCRLTGSMLGLFVSKGARAKAVESNFHNCTKAFSILGNGNVIGCEISSTKDVASQDATYTAITCEDANFEINNCKIQGYYIGAEILGNTHLNVDELLCSNMQIGLHVKNQARARVQSLDFTNIYQNAIQIDEKGIVYLQIANISNCNTGVLIQGSGLLDADRLSIASTQIGVQTRNEARFNLARTNFENCNQYAINVDSLCKGMNIFDGKFIKMRTGINICKPVNVDMKKSSFISCTEAAIKANEGYVSLSEAYFKDSVAFSTVNGTLQITGSVFENAIFDVNPQKLIIMNSIFNGIKFEKFPIKDVFVYVSDFGTRALETFNNLIGQIGYFDRSFYPITHVHFSKSYEKVKAKYIGPRHSNNILFYYESTARFLKGSVGFFVSIAGILWKTENGGLLEVLYSQIQSIYCQMDGLSILTKDNRILKMPFTSGTMKYALLKIFYPMS